MNKQNIISLSLAYLGVIILTIALSLEIYHNIEIYEEIEEISIVIFGIILLVKQSNSQKKSPGNFVLKLPPFKKCNSFSDNALKNNVKGGGII